MRYFFAILGMLMILGCSHSDQKTSTLFELNQDEKKIYDSLKENADVSILQNIDPLSIAKIYIYSQYESENDVTYVLYTQREGYVAWTKEEDQQIPKEHRGTKEQIKALYNNFENGYFVETSDYEGYIEYDAENNKRFQMVKDENGIWKVSFMPIQ